jgi:hypothetical protein
MTEFSFVDRSSRIKELSELIKTLVTQSGCCKEVEPGTNRYLCFCGGGLKEVYWREENILVDVKLPTTEAVERWLFESRTGKKVEEVSEDKPERIILHGEPVDIVRRTRLIYREYPEYPR